MSNKTTPKDVFLELGAIFTLYLTAGSLLTLFFQYINYWIPDPLAGFYGQNSIRWAMASLVIAFPIHLIIMRALGQEFVKAPENWQHAQGRVCFSRTIDPDQEYKIRPSVN